MQHESWCRGLFATLSDGGLWAVPRSGLVFRKDGPGLVLQDKIPGIVPDAEQEADFACIKSHFADAGIRVSR